MHFFLPAPLVAAFCVAAHEPPDLDATLSLRPFSREMETDRPDFTEGTATIEPGRVQLEFGYTLTHDDFEDRTDHGAGETLVRIGMFDRLELRVGWEGYGVTALDDRGDESGVRDTSLGLKYAILRDHDTLPSLSLIAALNFPTGAESQSADDVGGDIALAVAFNITDRLSLGSNLGIAGVSNDDEDRYLETFLSLVMGFGITDELGAYAEYYAILPDITVAEDEHYFNTGLTYALTPDLQFDARVGFGLNDDADDVFFGVGFSFRW